MTPQSKKDDYVLGTHDEEIDRLGLQHRVWRPRVLDAWQRAGFTEGQTVVDVGCGPGFATLDLADIVGPVGKVIAIDRSRRFLDVLERTRDDRGLTNIEIREVDLETGELGVHGADAAWCRWVLTFLREPRALLARIAGSLRPGGVFVSYEYFDYGMWKMAPPLPELEEFVDLVMATWREAGGEPDIARSIPSWMPGVGLRLVSHRPIVDVVGPKSDIWRWPSSFVDNGVQRLIDLGQLSPARGAEIKAAIDERARRGETMMITPGVLEMIAIRD